MIGSHHRPSRAVVLLGVIVLKEKIRPGQWAAIGLAGVGVLYLTFSYGSLPWIALTLAFSFAFYGLVKKTAPLNSIQGVTLETGILFLPSIGWLIFSGIIILTFVTHRIGIFPRFSK